MKVDFHKKYLKNPSLYLLSDVLPEIDKLREPEDLEINTSIIGDIMKHEIRSADGYTKGVIFTDINGSVIANPFL